MPRHNRFGHQEYVASPPTVDVAWLDAVVASPPRSPDWRSRMETLGNRLRAARVAGIYLVHGTFVGDDLLGLSHLLSHWSTAAGEQLRRFEKRVADWIVRDSGNYTADYASLFEFGLNPLPGVRPIPVQLFHWTSENHHLGRADGAVRLIDELSRQPQLAGQRVLLWGHSHGGNVLALVSNLLAADEGTREAFFEATRDFHTSSLVDPERRQTWQRVRAYLADPDAPLRRAHLDCVTFGTPIRYGWDSDGYSRLLHVIYHRPTEGLPAYVTRFPFSIRSAAKAKRGDYVQQVGIAGTNISPPLVALPAHMADRALDRFFHSQTSWRQTWEALKAGRRVPAEGETLLIDYHQAAPRLHHGARGHAIYTRMSWLLYHAELVVLRWYRPSPT